MVIIDILAQVTNGVTTGIAAGITSAGFMGLLIKHVINPRRHMNGKEYVSKDEFDGHKLLAEERHENIVDTLEKMNVKLDKLLGVK